MKIDHFKPGKLSVDELVKRLKGTGFQAVNLAKAVDTFEEMVRGDCKVFLGVAGALVPGGMKEVLMDLIENKWVDVIAITGANVTHDLIEALGHNHHKCQNWTDKEMKEKGFDRIYNVYMKNEVYQDLEDFIKKHWVELKECKTSREFLWKLGELCPGDGILKKCFEKKIPIFCPALSDSGIGLMVWSLMVNGDECKTGMFDDLKEIMDIAWTSKVNGVVYLGGGVPKNYIQQALQLSNDASFGVQISMDNAAFGGSSGAPLEEGISWGKMKVDAKFVDLKCDVTIALPIIVSCLKERIEA